MSGTVLNFTKIVEDGLEIMPGLKLSLKHLLTDDRYEPYTSEDLEELKITNNKQKSEIYAVMI
jgi:hypothetical protein